MDGNAVRVGIELLNGPTFSDIGAGIARVLQKNVIETGTFDVERLGFLVKRAFAKNDASGEGFIAEFKNRADFPEEPRSL